MKRSFGWWLALGYLFSASAALAGGSEAHGGAEDHGTDPVIHVFLEAAEQYGSRYVSLPAGLGERERLWVDAHRAELRRAAAETRLEFLPRFSGNRPEIQRYLDRHCVPFGKRVCHGEDRLVYVSIEGNATIGGTRDLRLAEAMLHHELGHLVGETDHVFLSALGNQLAGVADPNLRFFTAFLDEMLKALARFGGIDPSRVEDRRAALARCVGRTFSTIGPDGEAMFEDFAALGSRRITDRALLGCGGHLRSAWGMGSAYVDAARRTVRMAAERALKSLAPDPSAGTGMRDYRRTTRARHSCYSRAMFDPEVKDPVVHLVMFAACKNDEPVPYGEASFTDAFPCKGDVCEAARPVQGIFVRIRILDNRTLYLERFDREVLGYSWLGNPKYGDWKRTETVYFRR